MGPFYCPIDKKVYLDTSFFKQMDQKLGGGGDFAYAYVVAHEIGHHVQDFSASSTRLTHTNSAEAKLRRMLSRCALNCRRTVLPASGPPTPIRSWQILQPGDIEKGMATASAIGDDKLQTAARGYAVPDSFTHGSSAERVKWLTAGLKSGQISSCDTFSQ